MGGNKIRPFLPWCVSAVAIGLAGYFAFPHACLWLASYQLRGFVVDCSNTQAVFQWSFREADPSECASAPSPQQKAQIGLRIGRLLRMVEARLGKTAATLHIRGRQTLAQGNASEASRLLGLASALRPEDGAIQLDYGISLAEFGARVDSPELFVQAFEEMLSASKRTGFPDRGHFELAVLAEQIPAPRTSLRFWTKASTIGNRTQRSRALGGIDRTRSMLVRRKQFASQPLEKSLFATAPGYPEWMLHRALSEWISDPPRYSEELHFLSEYFDREKRDRWLADFLTAKDPAAQSLRDAYVANLSGNHEAAAKQAQAALDRFRPAGSSAGEIAASIELAVAYRRLVQAANCLKAIDGIESKAKRRGYRWMALRAQAERVACESESRHVDVIAAREALAEEASQSGFADLRLRTLGYVVEPFHSYATPSTAWKRGNEGLKFFWKMQTHAVLASNLYFPLHLAAINQGCQEAAFVLLDEAHGVLEDAPNQKIHAYVLVAAAQLLMNLGDFTAAKDYLALAANAPGASGLEIALARSRLSRLSGNSAESLRLLQNAVANHSFPFQDLTHYQRLELIPAMGEALLALNDLSSATTYFDEIVRLTLTNAQSREAKQRYASLLEGEAGWRGMVDSLYRNDHPLEALELWQRFRSAGREFSVSQVDSAEPSTAWISIATVPSGHIVWLRHRGQLRHFLLPASQDVTRQLPVLLRLVEDPTSPPEFVRDLAIDLGRSLLGPLGSGLANAATIVIDADQAFAQTPWPVLEINGRPLIDSHSIVLTHGWVESIARRHPKGEKIQPQRPLIVSGVWVSPSVSQQFPPLVASEHEIAQLKAIPGATERTGHQTSADLILEALKDRDSLHFSGHGLSSGSAGALVVAPTGKTAPFGLLSAAAIRDKDWHHLKLVVLASCSSAGADLRANPNFESVARAFLEGGAKQVVASRWNIDSISTADLMERFYESIFIR